MPPKTPTPQQPGLFPSKVPQMPEGYYASGPNPHLADFVAQHATPYDPATDAYETPPFDRPITTTKATAIYNMHTYWSKKPHDAIRQYIRHYTQPGDVVLDPFCGSGGTALAALMEGRAAIAIDLSPAATFITKNYCTPVDVNALQRAFAELEQAVQREMEWLYATRCDRCDGRALTSYTVYSQVFRCDRCLEEVALFDCMEAEGLTAAGKPKKMTVCPHCHSRGYDEEISTRSSEKLGAVPVLVSYECQEGCKPKRAQRRHNDPDEKRRRFFAEYDLAKIAEIEAKAIPYWYPPHRMMNVESETDPWGDKWRAGTSNFRTVAELFTKRNLWALALIRNFAENHKTLMFGFTGILLNLSRMIRESNTQFLAGTYYLPPISKEVNAWGSYSGRIASLVKSLMELNLELTGTTNLLISTQSSTQLSDITPDTVDYIFTDPPYGGSIQYGELNFIWESWLDTDTQWQSDEVIVNNTRGYSEEHWARAIRKSMSECFRVLKPGRWLSLCYHDTSEGTWQLLQDIMAENGFISEDSDTTLYIDKSQKSYNQYTAEKVTKRDLVINFRKPRPGELSPLALAGDEDQATFGEKARAILSEALELHPGSSGDRLYDILVSRMVRRGEFERHDFEALLAGVAEPVAEAVMQDLFTPKSPELFGGHQTVRWYLKESGEGLDESESAKEEAAAARLEAYMYSLLTDEEILWGDPEAGPGVHYSDLFERYLPLADKPRRLLQEWLPEFFFKTAEGGWRPPANEEERAQKAALRSDGSLRRIKRFARALIEGVPPAPRDHPANPATAADWLRQCRRAGLYALGRAIYEKGGVDFSRLDEESQLEVEEDYALCVRRG